MNRPGSPFRPVRLRGAVGLAVLAVAAGVIAAPAASAAAVPAKNGPIAYVDGMNWVEINPDGSDNGGEHVVTPTGGGFVAADGVDAVVFSPDGTKAVFIDATFGSLWISNADGTAAKVLAPLPPASSTSAASDSMPSWSSDGSTVFFSRTTFTFGSTAVAPMVLMSVPASGGAAKKVLPATDAFGDIHAALSPDGTKLAYTAIGANFVPSVVVVDAKSLAKITTIPNAWAPSYSPDGKSLVMVTFSSPQATSSSVSVGTATGTGLKSAYSTQTTTGAPSWSPDGTRLLFPVSTAAGGFDMVILDPATNQQSTVPGSATGESEVSWQNGPLYTGPLSKPTPTGPGKGMAFRLGGADRIETANLVGDQVFGLNPPKTSIAVLSRDDNFADALAGNALAAQKKGPLLLTPTSGLDARVAAKLTANLAPGATVYLLGGTNALSPAVADAVARLGFVPKRLSGEDRFSTATVIANEISPHPHTVLVATGRDFPDALAAGAAAATDPAGGVVLLSDDKTLPAATSSYLSGVDPARTSVYGVGNQGVAALNTQPGYIGRFTQLAGGDRFDTAVRVASDKTLFPFAAAAGLATSNNWPDALSGGALLGLMHAPLLLADGASMPAVEQGWLANNGKNLVIMYVFGGTQVVPTAAVVQAGDAAWGAGRWTPPAPGR